MNKKIYEEFLGNNSVHEIVKRYLNTLVPTNRSHNFFVKWPKIEKHIEKYKVEFNILNSLIGSNDFDYELRNILSKYPEVIEVIPILFALSKSKTRKAKRENGSLKVINDFMDLNSGYTEYNFRERKLSTDEIDKFINFFKKTGLKHFFVNLADKSIFDYAYGVDVGMDTHARKNRSGKAMELAIEPIIKEILNLVDDECSIELITQKKFNYLNKKYNVSVTSEIKNRKADFILIKDNLKVINIEANFYKGGGSKPQEIVDSYINRQTDLYNNNFNFIWISDGFGWKDQYNQTTKAFNKIDYLLNLNFVKKGLLEGAIRFIYNI